MAVSTPINSIFYCFEKRIAHCEDKRMSFHVICHMASFDEVTISHTFKKIEFSLRCILVDFGFVNCCTINSASFDA